MTDELVPLVVKALQELSEQQDMAIPVPLDGDTALFGGDGLLDSLGLVALVVAVEQAIEDKCGISVSVADERALSRRESPFRTIGTLAEYASSLIRGAA